MIYTTYGSCIDLDFEFLDIDGNPEDITTDTFGVLTPSNSAFEQAVFTKIDAEQGILHMFISADAALNLSNRSVNSFRLRRIFETGCEDNSPLIYVRVE